jgi:hypothetical protein
MTRPTSIILLALGLLLAASAADAALTTNKCLVLKLNAWSAFRKCQATENGKGLLGKPTDLGKCLTKFQEKLAQVTAKATKAAIACRYQDNGNGTVTDYDTGLQWEQKVSPGGGATDPHASGNVFTWTAPSQSASCPFIGCPNGLAYTNFLGRLNRHTTGALINFACFAFLCDWRLPTLAELQSIVDLGGGCETGSPCIDPIFGPTPTVFYWSSTTLTSAADFAWGVDFGDGGVDSPSKETFACVRAVRNSL